MKTSASNTTFSAYPKGLEKQYTYSKKLRYSADENLLKLIYVALCQSIITYGISVWGSAAKTTMLAAERAQRSVLKVMLLKPFRYPTHSLYAEAKVLTVRTQTRS